MAPRINQPSTHTLEEEPQPWQLYHQLGENHQPETPNKHLELHLPLSCVGGPQRKPLRWRVVRANPATYGNDTGVIIGTFISYRKQMAKR